jgi:hypothetical protein
MKKELMNLFLFIFICFIVYILFRNFNFSYKECMTTSNAPASASAVTPTSNGIAGNASAYGATLKAANIKLQDTFLVSKYRSDYENAILNLDDLINSLMLQTALSVNSANPAEAIKKLADMNAAKTALNTVMKFVDKGA